MEHRKSIEYNREYDHIAHRGLCQYSPITLVVQVEWVDLMLVVFA